MLGLSVIILFKSLLHVFCSLVFSAHNSSEQIVYIFYLYFCISDRVAQCGWGAGDKITGAIEEQSAGKRGE